MPQFNSMGRNDVSGSISRAAGVTAANGKSPYASSSAATTSAAAKQKMLNDNKSNPNKLAYWMQKTGGRKNAAYTLFKRQTQANRRGSM